MKYLKKSEHVNEGLDIFNRHNSVARKVLDYLNNPKVSVTKEDDYDYTTSYIIITEIGDNFEIIRFILKDSYKYFLFQNEKELSVKNSLLEEIFNKSKSIFDAKNEHGAKEEKSL